MKRTVLSLAVLSAILAASSFAVNDSKSTASGVPNYPKPPDFSTLSPNVVDRVVDGDTIVVQVKSQQTTIRLIGVDTPETVHPSKPVEHYGKEASQFTANLLKGERVYVVTDPSQGTTDKYGRTLAYIYRVPDGLFVNAEIIRQGYGHAYTQYPFKYMEEFRQLEQFARQAEKGLWSNASGSTPSPAVPPTSVPVRTVRFEGRVVIDATGIPG